MTVTGQKPTLILGSGSPRRRELLAQIGVVADDIRPPDVGLPEDGVLAVGQIGQPGWTCADVDFAATAHVRGHGGVRNRTHWDEQTPRHQRVTAQDLTADRP